MRLTVLMLPAACLACSVRLPAASTPTPTGPPSPYATATRERCCGDFAAVPTTDQGAWGKFDLIVTAMAEEFEMSAALYQAQFATAEAHANSLSTELALTATRAANVYATARANVAQTAVSLCSRRTAGYNSLD